MNDVATFVARDSQVRLDSETARHALVGVAGLTSKEALHLLRFSPVYGCPQLARLVETAVRSAQRLEGVGAAEVVVDAFEIGDGEDIVRVRRKAHGKADWITTKTLDVTVQLRRFVDEKMEMPI